MAAPRFRYRTILTLISRQNGKTFLLKIVALWFLYLRHGKLVLGAAQALNIARESWQGAVDLASAVDELRAEIAGVRYTNGEQTLSLAGGGRYLITAATRGAGRGLSVHLLILDELREHRTTDAWAALSSTTVAQANALTVCISNQGDDQSIVLNTLRDAALSGSDESLGLAEWSSPDDCATDDPGMLAYSNPSMGYPNGITLAALATMRATTSEAVFRTENMCQRVRNLDAAIDPGAWRAAAEPGFTLAKVRDRLVMCVDVAPDGRHVTLAGAAPLDGGTIGVEMFGAWSSTEEARTALSRILAKVRPRALGWYPDSPSAVLGADLALVHLVSVGIADRSTGDPLDWAPGVVEIAGRGIAEACQSLADQALNGTLIHPDDQLLNAHVAGAQKLRAGDGWRFVRVGAGHVDAAYAAAGAVRLARALPMPAPPQRPAVY